MVSMRQAEEHWHHQPEVTLLSPLRAFILQHLAVRMSFPYRPPSGHGPFSFCPSFPTGQTHPGSWSVNLHAWLTLHILVA